MMQHQEPLDTPPGKIHCMQPPASLPLKQPSSFFLIPKAVMLMHGTPPRMPLPPRSNAPPMEPAQTFQSRHGHADLELLEADGTLGRVHAVLLRRHVREQAGPPRRRRRQRRGRRITTAKASGRWWRASVSAVRGNANGDVGLAQSLEVREGPLRELPVADGTLVLLGDLRPGLGDGWQPAVDSGG